MEVKKGYKRTEVGVIPEDWEVKCFYDISNVNQGLQIAIHDRLKNPTPMSKKYITIQYLNDAKSVEYIEDYSIDVCCEKDDILMTRTGNTGMIVTGVQGVFHNNFFKINYDRKQVLKDYLIYYLKQKKVQDIIITKAGASTIPDLNHKDFYSIPIPLPPTLDEQEAIATALSDTDALIQSLGKLIAKKRAIKQGTMQELLKPKEDWVVKKLGEACNYQNGKSLERFFNSSAGYRVISIGNYSSDGKFIDNQTFISSDHINYICRYILYKNDLTMLLNDKTSIGTIIGRVLLIREDNAFVFNQRTMRLTPKKWVNPLFLYYLLNYSSVHKRIVGLAKPGTQIYVNTNDVIEFELDFPPLPEQFRIATILSDMDAEITALETKLSKYKQIKQGMMQNLLTGRIRLV